MPHSGGVPITMEAMMRFRIPGRPVFAVVSAMVVAGTIAGCSSAAPQVENNVRNERTPLPRALPAVDEARSVVLTEAEKQGRAANAPVASAALGLNAVVSGSPMRFRRSTESDRSADPDGFNTEAYAGIDENAFLAAVGNPLSTFSIDVDRASYSNVRRFIREGRLPPMDAVRGPRPLRAAICAPTW